MKAGTGSWWLSLVKVFNPEHVEGLIFYLLVLFLPTQLGKHFWPDFAFVLGQRVDYLSPTLYLSDIFILTLFISFILRKKIFVTPLFSFTCLFLSIGIFLSVSPFAGWYFFAKFLEISFLIWYVAHLPLSPRVTAWQSRIGFLFACGIIFESILALVQASIQGSVGGLLYFLGERTFSSSTPGIANASIAGQLILRPYGTFSHPNMLAGYLVVSMLLILYFYLQTRSTPEVLGPFTSGVRGSRFLLFASLIFGTIGLIITLSRTAISSWILVVLFSGVFFYKMLSRRFLFFILLGLSAIVLVAAFYPPILFRLTTFAMDQSVSERVLLAQGSFVMLAKHPLFGVGLNNFIPAFSLSQNNPTLLQPVHNIYLLIASETGFIGFFLFLFFLWWVGKKFFYLWEKSDSGKKQQLLFLGLAFFVILFSGMFDHYFLTLEQGQLLFAFVVGLIFNEIKYTQ